MRSISFFFPGIKKPCYFSFFLRKWQWCRCLRRLSVAGCSSFCSVGNEHRLSQIRIFRQLTQKRARTKKNERREGKGKRRETIVFSPFSYLHFFIYLFPFCQRPQNSACYSSGSCFGYVDNRNTTTVTTTPGSARTTEQTWCPASLPWPVSQFRVYHHQCRSVYMAA